MSRFLSVFCLLLSTASIANAADDCAVVIRNGGHDVQESQLRAAAEFERYEKECSNNSTSRGLSLGLEYGGAEGALGLSKSSTSEFCSTYDASGSAHRNVSTFARTVVREAYGAYLACKQLEQENVRARFTLMPRMLVVSVARTNNAAVFQGVAVSPASAMSCTRAEPGARDGIPVGRSENIELPSGKTVVVTCEKNDTDAEPEYLFGGADVAVLTDQGAATITLEPSRWPTVVTTEQIFSELERTTARLNATTASVESVFGVPPQTFRLKVEGGAERTETLEIGRAAFCALTAVRFNVDNGQSACRVTNVDSVWSLVAYEANTGVTCEATCLGAAVPPDPAADP